MMARKMLAYGLLDVAVAVAMGCGGPSRSASPDRVDAVAVAACPDDAALAALVRSRLSIAAEVPLTLRCAPGHFGVSGWAVVVRARTSDRVLERRRIVLATSGEQLAVAPPEAVDVSADSSGPLHAVDLDGDGVDELLEVYTHVDAGGAVTWLIGFQVSKGALDEIGRFAISPTQGCDATLTAATDRAYVVASGTATGCLPPGEHKVKMSRGHLELGPAVDGS